MHFIGAIFRGNLAKTHHLSILFQLEQEELVSRIGHQVEMIIIEEMPMLIPCLNFSISLIGKLIYYGCSSKNFMKLHNSEVKKKFVKSEFKNS